MYLIMSHHHHHPSWLKTFHHCQLSLEVILCIMVIETLTSLVQGYDSNSTASLPTLHLGLWVSDSHLCVPFSSCCLLYMEKRRDGEKVHSLGVSLLSTEHPAPNTMIPAYWAICVQSLEGFSFLFNHWAFAHATSSAWKTLWHLVRLFPPSFRMFPEGLSASTSKAHSPVCLLLQRHQSLWFEYLFS